MITMNAEYIQNTNSTTNTMNYILPRKDSLTPTPTTHTDSHKYTKQNGDRAGSKEKIALIRHAPSFLIVFDLLSFKFFPCYYILYSDELERFYQIQLQ